MKFLVAFVVALLGFQAGAQDLKVQNVTFGKTTLDQLRTMYSVESCRMVPNTDLVDLRCTSAGFIYGDLKARSASWTVTDNIVVAATLWFKAEELDHVIRLLVEKYGEHTTCETKFRCQWILADGSRFSINSDVRECYISFVMSDDHEPSKSRVQRARERRVNATKNM